MLGKIEGKRRRGRQRMRWLEVSITLVLKPNKDIIRKENYRPIITLRNRDAKILKETLENPIQKYIKRTVHHDKTRFIPRRQSWLNIQELVNIKHHSKKLKGENT